MASYKLYFRDSRNQRRQIAAFECEEAEALNHAHKTIHAFCEERNFRIYYSRIWNDPEYIRTIFDVGSHTEFFHLEPAVAINS